MRYGFVVCPFDRGYKVKQLQDEEYYERKYINKYEAYKWIDFMIDYFKKIDLNG